MSHDIEVLKHDGHALIIALRVSMLNTLKLCPSTWTRLEPRLRAENRLNTFGERKKQKTMTRTPRTLFPVFLPAFLTRLACGRMNRHRNIGGFATDIALCNFVMFEFSLMQGELDIATTN